MIDFYEKYNGVLLDAIKEYLPENVNPAGFLMEVLHIERSASYRRLRGEIFFTFGEAALIANALGVSLDLIIGKERIEKLSPFRMCMVEYEYPGGLDYEILEEYMSLIRLAKQDPTSQLIMCLNMIPQQIYLQYDSLTRFYLFKWIYYSDSKQTKAYQDVKVSGKMRQLFTDSFNEHLEFKDICYIFDKYIFKCLINDIDYFVSIGLISEEDKNILCEDIYKMIDYVEQLCVTGKLSNGNDVQIYLSSLYFDKTYYALRVFNHHISLIEVCVFDTVAATDKGNYDKVRGWIRSQHRMSSNITQCGELQRIEFFNEQRKLLSLL